MTNVPENVQRAYGPLPNGWRLGKLKFFADVRNSNVDKTVADDEELVRLCNYTDVYYNDRITSDLEFMNGSATEAEIEKFQLKRGQVIITKDSEGWDDIGIAALVTEDMPNVLCGYHLSVLEPRSELDGGFLAWLCRSEPLNDQFKLGANGVTRYGLGQYPMKNAFVALPPRETQQRIAQFLDEKTARIDGLIKKKHALLDRLAEKRQALITRAVTKGLNPDAPMKPSGIEWLGDIPVHWEVAPMWTAILKLESGVSVNATDVSAEGDQLGVLKTSAVYSGVFDPSQNKTVYDEFETERLSCRVRRGEIIISRMNTPDLVGASGLVVDEHPNLFLPDRLWQTKFGPASKALPTFIYLFLNSRLFRAIIASRATGTSGSMQNISQSDLLKIKLAIPPIVEQRKITSEVTDTLADIASQCEMVQRSIDVLNEYRAGIITAAVTGQMADLA
ncbi:type I restriction enzyme S subunit [Agrobacterium pusense]|uniref:restriction endonuclease subunit S n=1 Tax=Agrobacterium pusense TaxID=648995 RepID=UPI0028652879|nr:restriction endonuclease subunit S [Agrobacterium pusense]MDR6190601.1 type I restriction enzyme S subunit [Agrobacterium pusense]